MGVEDVLGEQHRRGANVLPPVYDRAQSHQRHGGHQLCQHRSRIQGPVDEHGQPDQDVHDIRDYGYSDQDDHVERPSQVDVDVLSEEVSFQEYNVLRLGCVERGVECRIPGGYDITRKECQVEIMSEDYLTTDTPLVDSATGTMVVKSVSRADIESRRKTRKRENLTERAKKELSKMGV